MSNTVLVTGGAGYIGSHAVLALLQNGKNVVVLDNLSNSLRAALDHVENICGKRPVFVEGDIRDSALLDQVFSEHAIEAVFHFAGLKAVGESVREPEKYYDNNVAGTLTLLKTMNQHGVFNFVFSSSATVYGCPSEMPISEETKVERPTNPYGRTKLIIEDMLRDFSDADERWNIALLRYFNPIGAHESGLLGEHPQGIPNNLLPYISQVAIGTLKELKVFGNDHPTPDGTGIRDYIHVVDLVEGHLKALDFICEHKGLHTWNLGTGTGYSVIEIIDSFEQVTGQNIPYSFTERRAGDVAESWSNPAKAKVEMNWVASRTLEDMIRDTWRWQSNYPAGYASTPTPTH
ncbi:UDP-glucose 4-epimerase GalE [Pseudomonas sp. LRP2-20]|uniref:UDP-glucose 4-epimerase GalE n=1 Tax=Pseudomonas sp. LRP2-20 TaxID=2944234 RepID=UPI0021891077|nr:UDP-glucose 4-epimerase GalE [Pseudomonas sp. LRP2-20]BDM24248.1 UDP-glucose 4-epimerase GalE [Pseudomonas sp. LRP2-20]